MKGFPGMTYEARRLLNCNHMIFAEGIGGGWMQAAWAIKPDLLCLRQCSLYMAAFASTVKQKQASKKDVYPHFEQHAMKLPLACTSQTLMMIACQCQG